MLLIGGLLWTVVGYLFFPNWVFTSTNENSPTSGPLIWPAGIFALGIGVVQVAIARRPAIGEWFNRRVWLSVCLILAACGVYFFLAWT